MRLTISSEKLIIQSASFSWLFVMVYSLNCHQDIVSVGQKRVQDSLLDILSISPNLSCSIERIYYFN
jgi:hypothetical protein